MNIGIMIRYLIFFEHADSRDKDYPVTHRLSKGGEANTTMQFPPFSKLPYRRFYILVASIMITMFPLVLGGCFDPPKPSTITFPLLCSNFQSTNTSANNVTVPTPATSTSPDGEPIGLSEGATIFDRQRPNPNSPAEVQYKLQAAHDWTDNPQDVVPSLQNALSIDQTDAEAQIYLENWQVLASKHPHITFVVGVDFAFSPTGGSRDVLQGAFTAQKECNNHNNQDDSQTQIILMIANTGGGNDSANVLASNAKFVAGQIADQASIDPTIVGIMGWPRSSDSINVNYQLKIRNSNLPMVSPSAASDELEARANFFRLVPTDKEQAKIAANFMLKTKKLKHIAILYDETTSYTNNLKDDMIHYIKCSTVHSAHFTGGDSTTLKDALNNGLAQNPDAIFFAGYATDLVNLLKILNTLPQTNNLLIVGGNTFAITNSYTNPLPDMHNVYFTAFASPNEWNGTNQMPPFFQKYKDNFGTLKAPTGLPSIDVSVMLGYDALSVLLDASQQVLFKQNTIAPSDLTQALRPIAVTNPLQGVTGRIAFDSNGNQDEHKMIFVEHIDGTRLMIDEQHGCLLKDNCSS